MARWVSFHAIDLSFFDELVAPLTAGEKANPERFLDEARRLRAAEWQLQGYRAALARQIRRCRPPDLPDEGPLWRKVKARLDRMEFKPEPLARLVLDTVEPELHLGGRPYLITEGSAERVASLVLDYGQADGAQAVESLVLEQLVRLSPELAGKVTPEPVPDPPSEITERNDLLNGLKVLFDLGRAARAGEDWGPFGGDREPAAQALLRELPFRSVALHARANAFWSATDVDGLAAVCRAAEVEPPPVLAPPWRLFARAIESFPALRDALDGAMEDDRAVGSWVAPGDVDELISFLATEGSRILRAATRHGEAEACGLLLRKMKECAQYARRTGRGYLEATGIEPPLPPPSLDAADGSDDDA